eukprot:NODE_2433_length_935_cov_324.395455.p1 GENE.NODE_2433_length_935_cov_324.395455~~NODE_2433_length_935_cov_324.395455.p1  ORF type:complete len:263 (-),score=86.49 NODE_2433_length_935_cov_324.395455:64-852(-)
MKHPIFSDMLKDIGPMNGTVKGVPDRRIHEINTLYRDAQGPLLLLKVCTNGPVECSWDSWAKQKPKADADTRAGRGFIKAERYKVIEGMANLRTWMMEHVTAQKTSAIKDDWAWWTWHGEKAHAGKLMTIMGDDHPQLFFDDNVDHNDARIVDCRDLNGQMMPFSEAGNKLIVKVNPIEALMNTDYFLMLFHRCHSVGADDGGSLLELRRQVLEGEEEVSTLKKRAAGENPDFADSTLPMHKRARPPKKKKKKKKKKKTPAG